jgi:SAM-dependent methyltransferase
MTDVRRLVAEGYDAIADTYLDRFGVSTTRRKWFQRLVESLPASNARVLDLGCGAGVPVARDLATLGHSVVGVDCSAQQIQHARRNVPGAYFIQADMCDVQLASASFDAVGAFYSIIHLPAAEQGVLFARIAQWLKPGGTLVASLGTGPGGDWVGEWLGTTMHFGHNSEAANLKLLSAAGLLVRHYETQRQDNEDAEFLWIAATKASKSGP